MGCLLLMYTYINYIKIQPDNKYTHLFVNEGKNSIENTTYTSNMPSISILNKSKNVIFFNLKLIKLSKKRKLFKYNFRFFKTTRIIFFKKSFYNFTYLIIGLNAFLI